jgi:signal peptidase II
MTRSPLKLDLVLGLSIVALDQLTKLWVRRAIPLHDTIEVIPGLLNLTHVRNTGTAFGFLNAVDFPYKSAVIVGVALLALVMIVAYARQIASETPLGRVAFTFIVSGAVGNLIDRALVGSVVDFVDAYQGSFHFWAFNVADSAITIGAILMLLDLMRSKRHVPTPV